MSTTEVARRADRQRYELLVEGEHAGHVTWFMAGGVTVLDHTLIDPAYGGRGLGSVLARSVLDDMRYRRLPYAVDCPFLRGWIAEHPKYSDVSLWEWPTEGPT